jgi:hypothetical protein
LHLLDLLIPLRTANDAEVLVEQRAAIDPLELHEQLLRVAGGSPFLR